MDFSFIINSVLLGIGLAMDAFSVSVADGLSQGCTSQPKRFLIAGTFGFFQFLMPLLGWFGVHSIISVFTSFQKFIPWIGFGLLMWIGIKMILEAGEQESCVTELSLMTIIIQGIATSIDALSVGFTISDYSFTAALVCSLIIGIVTFVICVFGIQLGVKVGNKYCKKAKWFGGIILIVIGIEILMKGIFSV